MAGYTMQEKASDGAMVDIPLAAKYDSDGNEIHETYASKDDLKGYLPISGLAESLSVDENGCLILTLD